ncbi:hypothetical protein QMK33_01650 [Hymenobacter sp. H14-R3]|uniref:hypothetical protein n=1 Tax=Hymenobacter sp. H14-R3 TaxID=3046308 RepID=UPI0024B9DC70|nr:hypothetical protein [Hymenobacter sp. H14-R3]MDJ0363840.1 hypothetical protein [Hymenobacter sp. H14-R3]
MRTFLLSLLLGTSLSAVAAPPGYHSPRRFVTPKGQPYHRPRMRLNFGVNAAYYNGDLTNRLSDNKLRVGFSTGLAQTLSPHLTFALDLSYFRLRAKDVFPSRDLAFASDNGLLAARLQYNLFADKSLYIGLKHQEMPVLVYVEAGAGALLYSPEASQYGLPLLPEAGNSYPGLAAVLPVGGGVTLRAAPRLALTLEGLYYFTSTDLLDDVSRRASGDALDGFATLTFKVEYTLGKKKPKVLVQND